MLSITHKRCLARLVVMAALLAAAVPANAMAGSTATEEVGLAVELENTHVTNLTGALVLMADNGGQY
jgi:hypothetical protein